MSSQQELPTEQKSNAANPPNGSQPTATAPPATPAASPSLQAALTTVPSGEAERAINAFASEANFKGAYRMANALSQSSLVPEAYRNNIPNVLIAIELANRIGASVLMVMQNLDIIHGRPGWRAQFLIATVNTSNRFTPLRFRWVGKEGTDAWGCRAVAKDRETHEECVGSLITIKTAKDEGWYQRNGSKWKTLPEQMLLYRAAAFWTRVYAPELSMGMQTADEIVDTTGYEVPNTPAALTPGSPQALEAALMGKEQPSASPGGEASEATRDPGQEG